MALRAMGSESGRSGGWLWVAVSLALWAVAVTMLAFAGSGEPRARWVTDGLGVATLYAAITATVAVALRASLRRGRRLAYDLDETSLTRRLRGHPDLRIALDQITAVQDQPGWLVVTAGEPPRRMAIPKAAAGYDAIRAVLAARLPIVRTRLNRRKLAAHVALAAALVAADLISLTLAVWSPNRLVATVAAGVAVALAIWGARPILAVLARRRRLQRAPQPPDSGRTRR
ncbi:MAG: hypothetical protein ACRD2E_13230 [Terriglobales bacterium]